MKTPLSFRESTLTRRATCPPLDRPFLAMKQQEMYQTS